MNAIGDGTMGARFGRAAALGGALAVALGTVGCAAPSMFGEADPSSGAAAGLGATHATKAERAWLAAGYGIDEAPFTLDVKPVAEGRLTSGFGLRRNPTGFKLFRKRHRGVDYAAPAGTPVYAAGDGTVDRIYTSSSYGNYLRIAHENGFQTVYAHLAAFAEGIEEGSAVERGQQIGAVGMTGSATGNHLHFELVHRGERVDPLFAGH